MAPVGWNEPPELRPGELHLWWGRVPARGWFDPSRSPLATEEEERALRFHRELHRDRFRWRRIFQRRLLASYLRADPAELEFRSGEHGKPRLAAGTDVEFNLSHSGDEVLLGVARGRPLGVDIQLHSLRTSVERLADQVLSPRERAAFGEMASEDREEAFFRIWARKEALLKATGSGLSVDPRSFSVGFEVRAAPSPVPVAEFRAVQSLAFLDLVPPVGSASACVASSGVGWVVRFPQGERTP